MIFLDIETVPLSDEIALSFQRDGEDPCFTASTTPPLAKIVCVGMVNDKGTALPLINGDAFGIAPSGDDVLQNERAVVEKTLTILGQTERWPVVTFNGRAFDFIVLVASALRHNVKIPKYVENELFREYRYAKIPNNVDMYDILSNYGACKRGGLRAWCVGLGIGDPKKENDGSKVMELVKAKEHKKVAEYCISDCKYLAKLYERWSNFG